MPENESDPPQFKPKMILDAGIRHARFGSGLIEQLANLAARGFDGAAGAAAALHGHADQALGRGARLAGSEIMIDLVDFAAEADDERGGDVGMIENAGESALELRFVGALRHAAAFAVRERDDAIDVRRQNFVFESSGNRLDGVGGAVARSHDRDVVAGARTSVRAFIAEELGYVRQAAREKRFHVSGNSYTDSISWNERLCVWTCSPALISRVARPMR